MLQSRPLAAAAARDYLTGPTVVWSVWVNCNKSGALLCWIIMSL